MPKQIIYTPINRLVGARRIVFAVFAKMQGLVIRYAWKHRRLFHRYFDWLQNWAIQRREEAVPHPTLAFVDGDAVVNHVHAHHDHDITLSQLACERVCSAPVEGECPYPFEVNTEYWTTMRRLPLLSSYRRRQWTPAFEESEDTAFAGASMPRRRHVKSYTINNGEISGLIY